MCRSLIYLYVRGTNKKSLARVVTAGHTVSYFLSELVYIPILHMIVLVHMHLYFVKEQVLFQNVCVSMGTK